MAKAKTYGTCKLDKKRRQWKIEAEPHVIMRLKRVFGRFGGRVPRKMALKDTLEVCRDLAWFCERWPLKVSPTAYLLERAATHEKRMADILAVFAGNLEPREFKMALPPRDYQKIAAEALLRQGALLLADELGLGKTVSAIAALTEPSTRPALVVTLASLPVQWEREINRFAPALRTHIIKKRDPYPITKTESGDGQLMLLPDQDPDVIITSYHKLDGWQHELAGKIKTVVFDEVQELRTGVAQNIPAKYSAACNIAHAADYRIGLTGTPIYNYGGEFWAVLNALMPSVIGERGEFAAEWCGGSVDPKASIQEPRAFGTYLRDEGLMLRRTTAEVGRELPGMTTVLHHIEADERELKKIQGSAAALAQLIVAKSGMGFDKMRAAEEFNNLLRQTTGIAKAPFVAAFVRLLVESGEKVLLYGWHRAVYDIWMSALAELNPVMYTGSESLPQKRRAVDAFQSDPDTKVMIMSLRAGAGLDGLQKAARVAVYGELDWSPGVHEQCGGRLYRDGQPDPVTVYYLLADTGSDPIVSDVLGLKRGQIEGVRDPERALIEKLEVDPNHVHRLAAGYLAQLGITT